MQLKRWIFKKLTKHLLPVVDMERVLTSDKKGNLYLNGVIIEAKKYSELEQEVTLFRNSALWDLLQNTLKHQAQVNMFEKSKTVDDILFAKAILYTLDVQEKIIKLIYK